MISPEMPVGNTANSCEGLRRKSEALDWLQRIHRKITECGQRSLLQLCLKNGQATIDEIRDQVPLPAGINPTVFGAVPRKLAKSKIIALAGYEASKRPESHGRPISVWRIADAFAALKWLADHPPIADGSVSEPKTAVVSELHPMKPAATETPRDTNQGEQKLLFGAVGKGYY